MKRRSPKNSKDAMDEIIVTALRYGSMTISGEGIEVDGKRVINQTPVPVSHFAVCSSLGAFLQMATDQADGTEGLSCSIEPDAEGRAFLWAKVNPFTPDKVPFCIDVTEMGFADALEIVKRRIEAFSVNVC